MDSNNFLKNGLVNVKVDPDKVNAMLLGVPFKVVEGKISELKVSIENTASKVEVIMGKVELIAYLDDHSQFRFGESAGGNYVVF